MDTPDNEQVPNPASLPRPIPENSQPRFSQKAKLLPGIVLINRKPSLQKFYVYYSRREPWYTFSIVPGPGNRTLEADDAARRAVEKPRGPPVG